MVIITKSKKGNRLTAKIRGFNKIDKLRYQIIDVEVKYEEKNGKVKVV